MLNYLDVIYNKDVIEGKIIGKNVHARIGIAEVNYKIKKPKHTLRSEFNTFQLIKSDEYYKDQGAIG